MASSKDGEEDKVSAHTFYKLCSWLSVDFFSVVRELDMRQFFFVFVFCSSSFARDSLLSLNKQSIKGIARRVVDKLLAVRKSKIGTYVDLDIGDVNAIIQETRSIFLKQPMLIETDAPINICGKIFVLSLFLHFFEEHF